MPVALGHAGPGYSIGSAVIAGHGRRELALTVRTGNGGVSRHSSKPLRSHKRQHGQFCSLAGRRSASVSSYRLGNCVVGRQAVLPSLAVTPEDLPHGGPSDVAR